jgi:DNA repair protein RadD
MFQPRPYQVEAHSATISFLNNESGHGIMCASGGAGKSVMIANDAEYIHAQGERVVVLADRAKLLEQNFAKFTNKNNVGLVSAGLGEFNYKAPIVVGGIQTLYNKQHLIGSVGKILIDECNGVGNDFESDTRYHQFIRYYPHARIIGYTATPFTLQEGLLNWGKIYHKIPYSKLVADGWLVPLTNKIKDTPELSGVAHSGKEYNLQSLSDFMCLPELVVKTAKSIAESVRVGGRKKGLVFCVDRKHAEQVTMALIREGVRADILLGTMPESQRAQKYLDFAGDYIDCLVNVEIATTGLDFPFVDWIACLRRTESLSLWHQILYRGVRTSPNTGKVDCLLLDYSGNLQQHGGLMNQLCEYMGSAKKKIGKPLKICPNCEGDCTTGSNECSHCGYEFLKEDVARELQHEEEADLTSDINKAQTLEKFYTLTNVNYSHHHSTTGNQSLRVEYCSGKFYCSEFIPFGNSQFWAKRKCLDFIRPRTNVLPETIKEALDLCESWKKPKIIKVRPQKNNPKYYEIVEVVKWA